MPIPLTCVCGYSTIAPDSAAGKRGKCRKCGATISIPSPDDDIALVEPEPPARAIVVPVVDTEDEPEPEAPAVPPMGREPWFYVAFVLLAEFLMAGGIAVWGIWTWSVAETMQKMSNLGVGIAVMFLLFPPFLALLGTLVTGLGMLIAVDLARNIRVLRLQGHMR